MPHSSLKLMPGVDVNKTPALNEAAISQSQLIRFIPDRTLGGLVQKLGGWTRFYAAQIGSTVRALRCECSDLPSPRDRRTRARYCRLGAEGYTDWLYPALRTAAARWPAVFPQ